MKSQANQSQQLGSKAKQGLRALKSKFPSSFLIAVSLGVNLLAAGCSSQSEFAVTPNEVVNHKPSSIKMTYLKTEDLAKDRNQSPVPSSHKYKKGDRLPDGSVAETDMQELTVGQDKNTSK